MRAWTKYLITMAVGLILTGLIAFSRGLLEQTELVRIYHILCDSFFVVGILTSSVGALIFVSNEGAFDPLIYGVKSFFNIFKKRENRNLPSYYDYRMARNEHKFPFGFILICGMVFLAVSVVMYMQYCKYRG
jgi:hypothetical protein